MAEDEDLLGKDKQEKVLSWLESKWPKEKRCCEICGEQKWSMTQQYHCSTGLLKGWN
jgi:hypothetical protein